MGLADSRPPSDAGNLNNFDLEDRPTPPGKNQPLCTWVAASPGFFEAVGLPLDRGRLLDSHSLADNVVVVDRAWAARFYPNEEVLGKRIPRRWMHDLPVDHGGRRGRDREVDRTRGA